MPVLFVVARILLVVIFLVSGVSKFMDLAGTAQLISQKVQIPGALAGLAAQAEAFTKMTTPQMLAIAAASIEVGGGLLVAFNVATRFGAAILILYTIAATYYFHDFWNQTGADRMSNIIHAQKNLSLLAGLLMLFALGSWRPAPNANGGMEIIREN